MELIAATRVVKAQQAANEARPYSRAHHPGDPGPRGGRRRGRPPAAAPARRGRKVGIVVLSRRPRPGRRVQHHGHPGRRARDPGRPARTARSSRSSRSAGRPRRYFRFRDYPIDASFEGFTERPDVRGRPRDRRPGHRAVRERRRRPGRPRLHPVHLAWAPRRSSSGASCRSRPVDRIAEGGDAERHGRVRVRAVGQRRARERCCPATSRAACSPRCSTPPRRSSPAGSGP